MVSISDITTVKYWQNLVTSMDTAKEKIPKQCQIVDTCFMSLATIGGIYLQDIQRILIVYKKIVMIFCQ